LYTDPRNGKPYADNAKRFILFSRSVLETLTKLQWQPDVIHCHDWPSGLVPLFLKTVYRQDAFFQKMSSLFTVHSFSNHGQFDASCTGDMALGEEVSPEDVVIDAEGNCDFLRAGIVHADLVNTVSKKMAEDVLADPGIGSGFMELLRKRGTKFSGIPGGLDDVIWDPETDAFIPQQFSVKDLQGKTACRASLMERFKLKFPDRSPIVALNAPMTEEKGVALIQESFERIMKLNIAIILNGSGDKSVQRFFTAAEKKYPGRMGVSTGKDTALSHLIYAGADMVLIPSKFETNGIERLSAMRYGTVPVVHPTGGLADRIRPFSRDSGKGTGFVFEEFKARSLLKALEQAVRTYKDEKHWSQLMKACMREDLSWRNPAKKYIQLYNRCLPKKR
jgi:starch synthase